MSHRLYSSRKSNKKMLGGIRAIKKNHALTLLNQKENQLILNIFANETRDQLSLSR
jgi:hypothetical protein